MAASQSRHTATTALLPPLRLGLLCVLLLVLALSQEASGAPRPHVFRFRQPGLPMALRFYGAKHRNHHNHKNHNQHRDHQNKRTSPAPLLQDDCNTDMMVSAVCYHCGSMNAREFHTIHSRCCVRDGPYRQLCNDWYTTDPWTGGRFGGRWS